MILDMTAESRDLQPQECRNWMLHCETHCIIKDIKLLTIACGCTYQSALYIYSAACAWFIWSHHDALTIYALCGFMTVAGRGKHIHKDDSRRDLTNECGHSAQI